MAEIIHPYVHELLRDLRELTNRQFIYEDPWHGFVPYDGAPTEYQIGPAFPFAELGRRDKADVLEFINWEHYREKGLDWRDQNAVENNVVNGKPPTKWLQGTSFLDPALRAERREQLIQETFELSREIGYAHFLAENFDRPDPALVRLNPEERKAFLRQWWDGARERMYASYLEQVTGQSNEELARNLEAYRQQQQQSRLADYVAYDTSEAVIEKLESFGDEFERLAKTAKQKELAASFQQFVGEITGAGARDAYRQMLEKTAAAGPEQPKDKDKGIER